MKEYVYRKIVKYQNRPISLAVDAIVALVIIFSGPVIFSIPFLVVFLKVAIMSQSQVKYLLPRSMEDMQKQCRMNVIMICMETSICMLLWFVSTILIYDRLGEMIRAYSLFAILWVSVMILSIFRLGLDTQRNINAGVEEIEKKSQKKDILQHFTDLFAIGIVNVYLGTNFCLNWLGLSNKTYENPIALGVLVFTIVLLIIEIFRYARNWKIAEYSE